MDRRHVVAIAFLVPVRVRFVRRRVVAQLGHRLPMPPPAATTASANDMRPEHPRVVRGEYGLREPPA